MSATPNIPDDVFDKTHVFYSKDGTVLFPPATATNTAPAVTTAVATSNPAERYPDDGHDDGHNDPDIIHSVLLADGIHHHIDAETLENLPHRFDSSSNTSGSGGGKSSGGGVKAGMTWFGTLCIAGIGMFVEAYIIITTGQVKTVWHEQLPTCFTSDKDQTCPENIQCCDLFPNTPTFTTEAGGDQCSIEGTTTNPFCSSTGDGTYNSNLLCDEAITNSISYSEFAGIMLGMLLFGTLIDYLGRNTTGLITSTCMIVGITVMTFVSSSDYNTMFLVWSIFFGLFGLGVGGEYPLSAANASATDAQAKEDAKLDDEERRKFRIMREHEKTARRGETIGIVFAMQGLGAVCGSIFLLVLLFFSEQTSVECDTSIRHGSNSAGYDPYALEGVWRSFYFIGSIFVAMVLLYRYLLEGEGSGHQKIQARKDRRTQKLTYGMIFRLYGTRIIGTGGCWCLWDICFYGLKLFSGPIFAAINPDGDLAVSNGYLLINNLVALVVYYLAAKIIDIPSIGRVRVQGLFFLLVSIVFLTMSQIFSSASPGLLMGLFFLSSFLGQFVNTTTYVMAAETYPTELRGTLHGLSAFLGKAGALMATIIFGTVDTPTIFFICGCVGLAGCILTVVFSADMTHVSLAEHDAYLELFIENRSNEYKGKLNARQHLALIDCWIGWHGDFDPEWAMKLVRKDRATHHQQQNAAAIAEGVAASSTPTGSTTAATVAAAGSSSTTKTTDSCCSQ